MKVEDSSGARSATTLEVVVVEQVAPGASGGGGGSCFGSIGTTPPTWRNIGSNLLWMFSVLGWCLWRARRERASLRPARVGA